MKRVAFAWLGLMLLGVAGCTTVTSPMKKDFTNYTLDYTTPVDVAWQARLEEIDKRLRAKYGMAAEQTSVGLLDLNTLRFAAVRPDRQDYAASVPKIGILLGYFQLHPQAAPNLDTQTRHELGDMIKQSSNEMAAKYSRQVGLKPIQTVIDSYHLYDAKHGGGLWVGKHYGQDGERYGDPVGDNSHAATVRQLVRYYLLLEQGRLVSPAASKTMREIFESPDIPHRDDKFVKGLEGREVQVLRKAGWWEDWFLDSAIITGSGRHYIAVAMTHHPKGEEYLIEYAAAVDDLLQGVCPVSR